MGACVADVPQVNYADERIEWPSGTRREALTIYYAIEKTIHDPVITTDPIVLGIFPVQAEIVTVYHFLDAAPSPSPSVTFSLRYGTDITAAGTEVVVAGIASSATTIASASPHNAFVAQNNFLWMDVTAKTGTVYSFTVIVKYRMRI